MKFAKELLQTALPEWRVFFISYKRLKRVLKSLIEQGSGDDVPFWTALGEELSRVKRFYESKHLWAAQTVAVLEENVERLEIAAASQRMQKREEEGGSGGSSEGKIREEEGGKSIEPGSSAASSKAGLPSGNPPITERLSSFSSSSYSADRPPRPPPVPSPLFLATSPLAIKLSSPLQSSLLALQSYSSPLINENVTPSALASSSWSDFSPADRSRTASSFDSDVELPSLLASPDRPAGTSPPSFAAQATSNAALASSTLFTPGFNSNDFQSPMLTMQEGIITKRSSDFSNPKYGMSLVRTVSKESQSSAVSATLLRAGSPFSSIVSDDERLTPNFLFPSMHREDEREGGDVEDTDDVHEDDEVDGDDVKDVKSGVKCEADVGSEDVNDTNDSGSVLTTNSTPFISSSAVHSYQRGTGSGGVTNERVMRTRYKHFFRVDQSKRENGQHLASVAVVSESYLNVSEKSSETSPEPLKISNEHEIFAARSEDKNQPDESKHQQLDESKHDCKSLSSNNPDLLEKSVVEEGEPILPHVEYAAIRKRVHDLEAELSLLSEYCRLNDTAVYKIVKKHDKLFNSSTLTQYLSKLHEETSPFAFLVGVDVNALVVRAEALSRKVRQLEPEHAAWSRIKVVTVGTFDVAHHGHVNLLRSMRAFGKSTIVGIHDDVSYAQLKGKPPEEPLEKRMAAIRDHCDVIFVIPSTDPTPYIAASLLPSDVEKKRVVYVRGEDMAEFPGRKWVESKKIPIYLLPRTESVSSTLIKAVSAVALTAMSSPGGSSSPTSSLLIRDRQLDVALGMLSFTT